MKSQIKIGQVWRHISYKNTYTISRFENGYAWGIQSQSGTEGRFANVDENHMAFINDLWTLDPQTATGNTGCICKRCRAANPWAAPNQKDGQSYICYECR